MIAITKVVAEQKARDMEAAEEEARQRGGRTDAQSCYDAAIAMGWSAAQARAARSMVVAARGEIEVARRRRKPMDVLSVVDVCVKGKNMVVKKNSKKKTDVAKGENGERLIK